MPNFGNPFAGVRQNKKISKTELIRAVRFLIAAEYEAVQMYNQLAESADSKLAIKVFNEVADEEKVHAGEFLRLLKQLDSKEFEYYAKGTAEVERMISNLK